MNSCFPQLVTGTMTQTPLQRTRRTHAVINEMEDGSYLAVGDNSANRVEWQVSYEDISDAEADTLLRFFESTEGTLGSFTFADPGANLLVWSQQLDNQAWVRATPLTVVSGTVDPFGGTGATILTNTSAAPLSLLQTVNLPGSMTATLSCYVYSASAKTNLTLTRQAGNSAMNRDYTIGTGWRSIAHTTALVNETTLSRFGLNLDPGSRVTIYGLSVVAQPAPSLYVISEGISGLYPNTRFSSDELTITRTGLNRNSCRFQLVSSV